MSLSVWLNGIPDGRHANSMRQHALVLSSSMEGRVLCGASCSLGNSMVHRKVFKRDGRHLLNVRQTQRNIKQAILTIINTTPTRAFSFK